MFSSNPYDASRAGAPPPLLPPTSSMTAGGANPGSPVLYTGATPGSPILYTAGAGFQASLARPLPLFQPAGAVPATTPEVPAPQLLPLTLSDFSQSGPQPVMPFVLTPVPPFAPGTVLAVLPHPHRVGGATMAPMPTMDLILSGPPGSPVIALNQHHAFPPALPPGGVHAHQQLPPPLVTPTGRTPTTTAAAVAAASVAPAPRMDHPTSTSAGGGGGDVLVRVGDTYVGTVPATAVPMPRVRVGVVPPVPTHPKPNHRGQHPQQHPQPQQQQRPGCFGQPPSSPRGGGFARPGSP
jgi:hypothetical protein